MPKRSAPGCAVIFGMIFITSSQSFDAPMFPFVCYASFIYQDSLIKAVYSIMLRWLRNDPFIFVMDFPTPNYAFVLASFCSHTPLIDLSIVYSEG